MSWECSDAKMDSVLSKCWRCKFPGGEMWSCASTSVNRMKTPQNGALFLIYTFWTAWSISVSKITYNQDELKGGSRERDSHVSRLSRDGGSIRVIPNIVLTPFKSAIWYRGHQEMTRWLRMQAALASASQHRIAREGQNRSPLGIQCLVFSGSLIFRLLEHWERQIETLRIHYRMIFRVFLQ